MASDAGDRRRRSAVSLAGFPDKEAIQPGKVELVAAYRRDDLFEKRRKDADPFVFGKAVSPLGGRIAGWKTTNAQIRSDSA